jgi:hypothetical protein
VSLHILLIIMGSKAAIGRDDYASTTDRQASHYSLCMAQAKRDNSYLN